MIVLLVNLSSFVVEGIREQIRSYVLSKLFLIKDFRQCHDCDCDIACVPREHHSHYVYRVNNYVN